MEEVQEHQYRLFNVNVLLYADKKIEVKYNANILHNPDFLESLAAFVFEGM